jgi:hypothetical protein
MHRGQQAQPLFPRHRRPCGARWLVVLLLALAKVSPGMAASDEHTAAAALQSLHADSIDRLRDAPFDRPMWIESRESGGRLHGDLHARIDHPFARVESVLGKPEHWCELLTLLPNIRQCRVDPGGRLLLRFARRYDQRLEDTYPVAFEVRTRGLPGEYLEAVLEASEGPLGTSNYRVLLRAVPVGRGQTFVHVHYGYAYGLAARVGAQAYLATRGRDKLGFTVTGLDRAGQPQQIGGLRGAVERNAMRTYLAIDAYLANHSAPAAERREHSLQAWLDAVEHYPRQLAEADRSAYFAAKRQRP